MDVESSQLWSTASTMSSHHHFIVATVTQNYQNLGQLCQYNCVRRVLPYAYQQQMMVFKHCPYIKYGCGKQSVVVYSLNVVIMPSFHSSHSDPNYQNQDQLCQCNCVRVHPYAYPQHMIVLKHFLCMQYGCGKQTVVVYSLNNVIMPSFHSSHAGPNYQNQGQLCKCSSVRVHPYAYPHHRMLLKHFVCIQYRFGKQSVGVHAIISK